MENENKRIASYDPGISKLFFLMCLIVPVTLILAVVFYRDAFHFFRNAFSELGETVTPQGQANLLSRLIFSAGWMACGFAMINISSRYGKNVALRNAHLKRWLALAGGIGFFIGIAPNDSSHALHSVGMGMVVAVIYFLAMIFLLELRPAVPIFVFYVNMIILQSVVSTYAAAFFVNWTYTQVTQKFCVVGLLLVMEKVVTIAPEGFEWRAAIQSIPRR